MEILGKFMNYIKVINGIPFVVRSFTFNLSQVTTRINLTLINSACGLLK